MGENPLFRVAIPFKSGHRFLRASMHERAESGAKSQSPSNRVTDSYTVKCECGEELTEKSQSPSNRVTDSYQENKKREEQRNQSRNPLQIGSQIPTFEGKKYEARASTSRNPLQIGSQIPTRRRPARAAQSFPPVAIPFKSGHRFLR